MRIKKITHPQAWELMQARIDEAVVTKQSLVERPSWYENIQSGQRYYDLYGCVGWPTEVSDKELGMSGYVAIMGVVKPLGNRPIADADFQLLAEAESQDVPTLLDHIVRLRNEWGFGLHPDLLSAWFGEPERFVTTIALENERLVAKGGDRQAILIIPPDDFYVPGTFDHYVRSLRSAIVPNRLRFYFGGNEILKNKLREFKRDDPAVYAVGGMVHSLLSRCTWMDQTRENIFTVEEEDT